MGEIIPVEIVPYDPAWPFLFEQSRREILAAVGAYVQVVEHTGSTSVPGLAAKPVIDILIGVRTLADDGCFLPPLTQLGFTYIPQYERDFPQRRYLNRIVNGKHTHHLHIVEPGSRFFIEHLLFRDYLRTHPQAMYDYAALKYKLAEKCRLDREAYTDSKSAFIRGIIAAAENESNR